MSATFYCQKTNKQVVVSIGSFHAIYFSLFPLEYIMTMPPHLTYSPDVQAMHAMHATNKEVYLYPSMVKTALCLGFWKKSHKQQGCKFLKIFNNNQCVTSVEEMFLLNKKFPLFVDEQNVLLTVNIYGFTCPGLRERRSLYDAGTLYFETNWNR